MTTHTYAILVISKEAYNEIREKLLNAGYAHVIHDPGEGIQETIDMHSIALQCENTP